MDEQSVEENRPPATKHQNNQRAIADVLGFFDSRPFGGSTKNPSELRTAPRCNENNKNESNIISSPANSSGTGLFSSQMLKENDYTFNRSQDSALLSPSNGRSTNNQNRLLNNNLRNY